MPALHTPLFLLFYLDQSPAVQGPLDKEPWREGLPTSSYLYPAALFLMSALYASLVCPCPGWESQQPCSVTARIALATYRARTGHLPTVGTAEVVRVVGIILEHEGLFIDG